MVSSSEQKKGRQLDIDNEYRLRMLIMIASSKRAELATLSARMMIYSIQGGC